MIKPTLTSTAALFTLLGVAASAAISPDILGHSTHKRHHAIAERFGILDELDLHERDAATPPSGEMRSPSPASGNSKRDESALYLLLGCVSEFIGSNQPLLTHQVPWTPSSMQTCIESCVSAASTPYLFAGIIRGSECWCDGTDIQSYNAIMSEATTTDQSNCQDTCVEGTEKWCGGSSSYQIYYLPTNTSATTDPSPQTTASVAQVTPSAASVPSTVSTSEGIAYDYLGCYADGTDSASRVLRGPTILGSSTMTPSVCVEYCFQNGYAYAGVEYGQECYCGTTLFTDPASTSDGCTEPCSGDSSQTCGSALSISIYTIVDSSLIVVPTPLPTSSDGQWFSQGCFIDDITNRTLPFPQNIDPSTFSVDSCTTACTASGYTYAGLEDGAECYCGNDDPPTALQADAQDCDIVCPGGEGTCGGLLRLDVYSTA
jgi:hypothetical protein